MKIIRELTEEVYLFEADRFRDERGVFSIPFNVEALPPEFSLTQTMHAYSKEGVLRGLHYQDKTAPVAKIISCLRGTIFDVIVDLRVNSPTFGEWKGIYLNGHDHLLVYAPIGTAHGYLSMKPSDVFYYQSGPYDAQASKIIKWDDPTLKIEWPITGRPLMSRRDKADGISWQEYKANPDF